MLVVYIWLLGRIERLRERSELGASAVEYGLLVGLIAVAVVTAVYWLGQKTNGVFCEVVRVLPFGPADCTGPIP